MGRLQAVDEYRYILTDVLCSQLVRSPELLDSQEFV